MAVSVISAAIWCAVNLAFVASTPPSVSEGEAVRTNVEKELQAFRKMRVPSVRAGFLDRAFRHLALARFSATESICEEIERLDDTRPSYAQALLGVLAIVKDPEIIPWLEREISARAGLLKSWVHKWSFTPPRGPVPHLEWLTGEDEWFAFFKRHHQKCEDKRLRLKMLDVMAWYFHGDEAVAFFKRVEQTEDADIKERLHAQWYLVRHGREIDTSVTQGIMREHSRTSEGREIIGTYVGRMRHEVFVPWLLKHYHARGVERAYPGVDNLLSTVTGVADLKGKEAWEQWYASHKGETHAQWVAQRVAQLEALCAEDPAQALRIVEQEWMIWSDDGALLPHLQRWAKDRQYHGLIATILPRMRDPGWWPELRSVARNVLNEEPLAISPTMARELKRAGFDDSDTWEDFVTQTFGSEEDYARRMEMLRGS